jgi:hypothetical protein
MQKNRFAGAIADDSDDDVQVVKKQTKTQAKKEERKISDKPVKVNVSKMAEGGFNVVAKEDTSKPVTAGRPRRGPRATDDKPHQSNRANAINQATGNEAPNRRERQPFRGKAREEGHPFDR